MHLNTNLSQANLGVTDLVSSTELVNEEVNDCRSHES